MHKAQAAKNIFYEKKNIQRSKMIDSMWKKVKATIAILKKIHIPIINQIGSQCS